MIARSRSASPRLRISSVRQIGLVPERAVPGHRIAVRHARGIGAPERGRHAEQLLGDASEVERQMVALDAPAPRQPAGRAEDRHAVVFGIAVEALVVLDQAERLLEAHDVHGLLVTGLAQRVAQQIVQRGLRGGGHLLDRHAGALARHVVPVGALAVIEWPARVPALRLAQALDERRRKARHGGARGAPARRRLRQRRGAQQGRPSGMQVASAHGAPPHCRPVPKVRPFGRDGNP